jgi:hypothetical protein
MKYIVFLKLFFLLLSIPVFSQNPYTIYQKEGYLGLEFVETHKKITLPIYEKIDPCSNNAYQKHTPFIEDIHIKTAKNRADNNAQFWKVVKDGKYGIVDNEGKCIILTRYDNISYLIDTTFFVTYKDHKDEVLNKNGSRLIPPIYDRIVCAESSGGHFILKAYSGNVFSLINETGTILSTFPNALDADIQENFVILTNRQSGLKGACNLYGQEILPQSYDELDISFGVFAFTKDGNQA